LDVSDFDFSILDVQLEISAFWMALRDSLFAVDAVFGINLSLSLTFCG